LGDGAASPPEGGAQAQRGARGLGPVALLLAASVLLSRVLGYLREAVLAYQIGATAETDAYRAAFMLPDLLNYFLAGGALSIAFIPFYTRLRAREGPLAAERLLGVVLGTTGALAVVLTALMWWWADALVDLQFPRFTSEGRALTAHLTRILLPAQVFFVSGGILRGALMAHDRFATQALAPLLYNGAIIAGGALLGGRLGAEGFAWGALVGAVLGPFLAPLLDVWRTPQLRIRLRIAPSDPRLLRYLALAAPLMLGVTLLTVDEWYDKWFGGLLAEGTVAYLGYARLLMQMPVAIVGQAIATAALPLLSRLFSEGRHEELERTLLDTLRAGLALALLSGAAFFVFAEPVVRLLYEHGAFGAGDSARVVPLLRLFTLAVPAWITQQIAVRGFYARGDTWRPMLLGSAVALAAAALYYVLGRRLGAEGLALAGALGMSVNAVATLALARRLHGAPRLTPLATTGVRALAISVLAGLVAAVAAAFVRGPAGRGQFAELVELAGGGLAFGAVALAGVRLVGDPPMRAALDRVWRRLRRTR
jgi:putative peptidoglycan lipid II flippase